MNRRRARLLFAVSTLALLGMGCGDDIKPGTGGGTGGGTGEADAQPAITDDARLAVVKSVGEGVIFPTYQAFLTKAAALQTAVDAYAATPTADTLAAARAAYVSAMETWQWVEVMQIGVTDTLRGHIYSWNLDNACKVDEAIGSQKYAEAGFPSASAIISEYGLAALEYLLFHEGDAHACGATAPTDFPAGAELTSRRAAYAKVVAANIHTRAQELVTTWSPEGGGYLTTLTTASAPFTSAQQAMNVVTNAMYYVEMEVKDMKVAIPAGISTVCGATSCPNLVESRYAALSISNIEQNLLAFRALYLGGTPEANGQGFDDLLRAIGQTNLATRMEAAIEGALTVVGSFEGTLEDKVVSDAPAVMALYDAIKAITDILKTEFLSVLDLVRPATGAGDND